jgi:lipoprotein-releasing system ATP-binding protein
MKHGNEPEALVVRELVKEYPTRAQPLRVLDGVSCSLGPAEAVAIMGPSGSGKSTLLHIIGTLERPTAGTVRLGDVDPFSLARDELAAFRNERIGFVFQEHHLLPQCSALENVLIPSIARATQDGFESRARELLDRVGLADRLEHSPAELSGGERQRVAIARAFINKPRLILADEPTGNLDRKTAGSVADLFLELQRAERVALVVVTHSQALASRFGRQLELIDGRFTSS